MDTQILRQEAVVAVAKIAREDCLTIDEARDSLKVSRAMIYNYLNFLAVQRHKFPFDRKTYILKLDVERIRQFIQENRS